jgi:hypothetical protein
LKSVFVFLNVLEALNFHDRHGFVDVVLLTFFKGVCSSLSLLSQTSFVISSAFHGFLDVVSLSFPGGFVEVCLCFFKRP